MEFLIKNEPIIRSSVFVGLLVFFGLAEFLAPLAKRRISRPLQWFINLSIVIIDTITLRLLFPIAAVGVAQFAAENGIGLFNTISLDFWLVFVLSLLSLDLLIYGQHLLMHKVPLLWRLHRMHHTELGLDVTSAVRFHPIEIILSMLIKMAFVLVMGIPAVAVIIFEILLNGLALFNHSNLKLPKPIERALRSIIITPEIHWIHHSEIDRETNSNFGFNLSLWDKIFKTYADKPTFDYPEMRQGRAEIGFENPLSIIELLVSPFKIYPAKGEQNEP